MRLGTPSGLSSRRGYCMAITGVTALALGALAGEFKTQLGSAMDKWMYPFEFGTGGSRPVAPTFASFDPRFDTRDAEFLLGWQTQTVIPTNAVPSRYFLRRVRLNLTVGRDLVNNATGERVTFLYDPRSTATGPTFRTRTRLIKPMTMRADRLRSLEWVSAMDSMR